MLATLRIPLSAPDVGEEEIRAVAGVLRTPHLSLGPKVEEFEEAMRAYVGARHAVAVSSGTAGLHLCIRALGLGEGDEVIVPSFAFIAAANAVTYERAMPVFVDVDPVTLNLDPAKVEAAVTARTRAILVVHTFGCPAEMEELRTIARRHSLVLIEDACEAVGAEYGGRKVGSLGVAGVFAFYPNKQMTTGEGGMIVTDDPALAARFRMLRNQGRSASMDWFEHAEVGYNYRLSDIHCALGIAQLARIESILARREAVAHSYERRLRDSRTLLLPPLDLPQRRISWFVYVVRLAEGFTEGQRDLIRCRLVDQGIGCGRYFAPIHRQPAYPGPHRNDLPVTEAEASRTLALPFFNRIREDQIEEVCHALNEAIGAVA